MSGASLPWNLMLSTALLMTVMFRSPRKSNLTSPTFSMNFMSNEATCSPFFPVNRETYSCMGRSETTTPAAWVDACLASPSSFWEISKSFRVSGLLLYSWSSSGTVSSAFCRVIFKSLGMSLAMRDVSLKVMPSALPTSRMTPLAFSVPKAAIWATLSLPYFNVT